MKEHKAYCFDLDENIFNTEEVIFLWDTEEQKEIAVLQDKYYQLITSPRYTHINNEIEESMRNFRKNDWYLCKQLISCYKQYQAGDESKIWPSWGTFLQAINTKSPIAIITARGHRVEEFEKAFYALSRLMIEDKVISKIPNIIFYPVSNTEFCENFGIEFTVPISEKKALCFKDFMSKITTTAEGKLSIGFSDDSMCNIMKMIQFVLENNVQTWTDETLDIEYNFYDTGRGKPQCLKFKGKVF